MLQFVQITPRTTPSPLGPDAWRKQVEEAVSRRTRLLLCTSWDAVDACVGINSANADYDGLGALHNAARGGGEKAFKLWWAANIKRVCEEHGHPKARGEERTKKDKANAISQQRVVLLDELELKYRVDEDALIRNGEALLTRWNDTLGDVAKR